MAEVANPHKKFQFTLSIPRVGTFLAQEVTLPEIESDIVEHGDTNYIIKTGGIAKFGMLTVNSIQSANVLASDTVRLYEWVRQIQDPYAGGGDTPANYKVEGSVTQYATDGSTVLATWEFEGLWLQKINGVELSRTDSENTVHALEFCVDKMFKGRGAAPTPDSLFGDPIVHIIPGNANQ